MFSFTKTKENYLWFCDSVFLIPKINSFLLFCVLDRTEQQTTQKENPL